MQTSRHFMCPIARGLCGTAALLTSVAALGGEDAATAARGDWAVTAYAARISGERTWQQVISRGTGAEYVDAYLVAGALSRTYARYRSGRLEAEGQVVYNFGDQDHWEFNIVPIVARWERFPWSRTIASSAAFGLGLSYATEVPEVEVLLEGQSDRWLIYWVAELTAGPAQKPWAISLRLHHRSDAWGVMREDGGMNALGLGVRYSF